MPNFGDITTTRAEEKARHLYRRALEKAVRAIARGSGWRSTQGLLFRDVGGWFTGIAPSVNIFEHKTLASVLLKPMSIDPIFWEIVGTPENHDSPLSFRYLGAWTCPTPRVRDVEIDEAGGPEDVAARLLALAKDEADAPSLPRDLASYTGFLEGLLSECDAYLATAVCSLFVMGREQEAAELCAGAGDSPAGFLAPGGTFPDMALAWLRTRAATRTLN